ncbi:unnamed protein product [Blepharisma stoltei]|uniref:Uncharacterized protein n=1 Tax=Blepharisma stoltei TaxID=1481888 RepID=A0AAU9IKM4_9CILI|nr:unnamed protein product [Blepharisma stoltei]
MTHSTSQSLLTTTDSEIAIKINCLREEQKAFEAQERYIEAEMIIQKIAELKQKYKKEQVLELKSRQGEEKDMVENSYQRELAEFNLHWNSLIKEYIEKCNEQETKMMQKHREQCRAERERLEKCIPKNYKPSTQLLNLIKCKEKAVLAQKYIEADSLLRQIEEEKVYEHDRYLEARKNKIDQHMGNFEAKAEREAENLKKRLKTGLDELNKQKSREMSIIIKKYDNLRREIANAQSIEANNKERNSTAAVRNRGNLTFRMQNRSLTATPIRLSLSPNKRMHTSTLN